ncbi:Dynamin family-domain-containing protein [Colletotrichum cereale]|nr:Dynamin family-domain-containing protein [Colletotrichum cereale]
MATMADAPQPVLHDIAERVKAKEKARRMGMDLLQKLKKLLHEDPVGRSLEGLEDWSDNLGKTPGLTITWHVRLCVNTNHWPDVLKTNIKSREILVGVVGETGLGKSSLINALLGFNIVPISNKEACTASVCIFGWNDDISDGKTFRAKITFKSWEAVESELDAFKEELADLEETSQGNETDQDYESRYVQAEHHYKTIRSWSGLTKEQIRTYSPDQIIRNSKKAFSAVYQSGSGIRSHKTYKFIKSTNQIDFLEMLKQYVDSTTDFKGPDGGGTATKRQVDKEPKLWALVEQVEIFLRAKVLKNGIKIVDLPGVMDALESRAQIARNYLYRLDKRIVVTPAARAADNKAAAELILSERDTFDLEMDDMLRSDALCVAITKIDDYDTNSAESEYPTEEVLRICSALKKRRAAAEAQYHSDSDSDPKYQRYQGSGQKRFFTDKGTAFSQKRQRRESDGLNEEQDDLAALSDDALDFRLMALCIQARNVELKAKVEEQLLCSMKKKRASRGAVDSLPSVFPVSSTAFQRLERIRQTKAEKTVLGFTDPESTGIPGLRKWLQLVSLPYREDWADSDIHHLQVLIDGADTWAQDDTVALPKLTDADKAQVEDDADRVSKNLQKLVNDRVRGRLREKLSRMKPLRDSNLTSGLRAGRSTKGESQLRKAVENLNRMVNGWELRNPWGSTKDIGRRDKIHWSTFKACVRRRGGVFEHRSRSGRPKTRIHWMSDVPHSYWRGHADQWRDEFTRKIPHIKVQIRDSGLRTYRLWFKRWFEGEQVQPAFRELIKGQAYKLEHLFERYLADVRERISLFEVSARGKREFLNNFFARSMKPGFEAAFMQTAPKIMEKQFTEIKAHTNGVGERMFIDARNELENSLAEDIKGVSKDVAMLWKQPKKGCGPCIQAVLSCLTKRLCARSTPKKPTESIRGTTKKAVSDMTTAWKSEWKSVEVRLPKVELSDESDAENDEKSGKTQDLQADEAEDMADVMVKSEPNHEGH